MHFITYFGPRRGWTADEADKEEEEMKDTEDSRGKGSDSGSGRGRGRRTCGVLCAVAPQDILRILTHATEMATTRG